MEPTEQAPSTPPPRRRRRRWLIAALVLVLVSGVAWWQWPRGDARFVGKWDVTSVQYPDEHEEWTLHSNGTGRFDGYFPQRAPWLVRENDFIFGRKARRPFNARLQDFWTSIAGGGDHVTDSISEILLVEPNQIRMRSRERTVMTQDERGRWVSTGKPIIEILTRIPE